MRLLTVIIDILLDSGWISFNYTGYLHIVSTIESCYVDVRKQKSSFGVKATWVLWITLWIAPRSLWCHVHCSLVVGNAIHNFNGGNQTMSGKGLFAVKRRFCVTMTAAGESCTDWSLMRQLWQTTRGINAVSTSIARMKRFHLIETWHGRQRQYLFAVHDASMSTLMLSDRNLRFPHRPNICIIIGE